MGKSTTSFLLQNPALSPPTETASSFLQISTYTKSNHSYEHKSLFNFYRPLSKTTAIYIHKHELNLPPPHLTIITMSFARTPAVLRSAIAARIVPARQSIRMASSSTRHDNNPEVSLFAPKNSIVMDRKLTYGFIIGSREGKAGCFEEALQGLH